MFFWIPEIGVTSVWYIDICVYTYLIVSVLNFTKHDFIFQLMIYLCNWNLFYSGSMLKEKTTKSPNWQPKTQLCSTKHLPHTFITQIQNLPCCFTFPWITSWYPIAFELDWQVQQDIDHNNFHRIGSDQLCEPWNRSSKWIEGQWNLPLYLRTNI